MLIYYLTNLFLDFNSDFEQRKQEFDEEFDRFSQSIERTRNASERSQRIFGIIFPIIVGVMILATAVVVIIVIKKDKKRKLEMDQKEIEKNTPVVCDYCGARNDRKAHKCSVCGAPFNNKKK